MGGGSSATTVRIEATSAFPRRSVERKPTSWAPSPETVNGAANGIHDSASIRYSVEVTPPASTPGSSAVKLTGVEEVMNVPPERYSRSPTDGVVIGGAASTMTTPGWLAFTFPKMPLLLHGTRCAH